MDRLIVCPSIILDLSMDSDFWAARLAATKRQYALLKRNNHSSRSGQLLCPLKKKFILILGSGSVSLEDFRFVPKNKHHRGYDAIVIIGDF